MSGCSTHPQFRSSVQAAPLMACLSLSIKLAAGPHCIITNVIDFPPKLDTYKYSNICAHIHIVALHKHFLLHHPSVPYCAFLAAIFSSLESTVVGIRTIRCPCPRMGRIPCSKPATMAAFSPKKWKKGPRHLQSPALLHTLLGRTPGAHLPSFTNLLPASPIIRKTNA